MVVLHTCKNEEDLNKNEGARVLTRLYMTFFRRSSATNSEVSGRILPNSNSLPARTKEIQSKMKELEC